MTATPQHLPDLFTTPKAENPVAVEIRRLNAAAVRVLTYLQAHEGEWVSNATLASPIIGGLRFGGRIFELRQHGWIIEDQRPKSGGTWRYRLVGQKTWAGRGGERG